MEDSTLPTRPEAATDEPASPSTRSGFASPEAERLYWRAYMDGARASGRAPGHAHVPAGFDSDLTRDGREPGLTSSKLLEPWPEQAPPPRAPRSDGWTDEKIARFLAVLASTGVVADACRAVGMSRDAAYSLRGRAAGRAFALAWDAALLIARRPLSDDAMSRARHGVIDRVYRNGELVAERHRYDNRLTMAVLARLDRLAEGHGDNAPVIRAVADEFDQFVSLLPQGNEAAEAFLTARFPPAAGGGRPIVVTEPPGAFGTRSPPGSEAALLARLDAYERYGAALPCEADTSSLDPATMESWTEKQWELADFTNFLENIGPAEWPDCARDPSQDGSDGMCKLRKLYLRRFPPPRPAEPEEKDAFEGCSVWEQMDGTWMTDFPPPDGFEGWEEGEPGESDYRRELTREEMEAIGADAESEALEKREWLAALHAARKRYFGLDEAPGAAADERSELPFSGDRPISAMHRFPPEEAP